jgi:hypothetical protein
MDGAPNVRKILDLSYVDIVEDVADTGPFCATPLFLSTPRPRHAE